MIRKSIGVIIGFAFVFLLSSCSQNRFDKEYNAIVNEEDLTRLEMTIEYTVSGGNSIYALEGKEVVNFYEDAIKVSAEIEDQSIYNDTIYVEAIIEETEDGPVYLERVGLRKNNSQPFILTPFSEDSYIRNQDQTSDILFHLTKYESKKQEDGTYIIEVPLSDLYENYRSSLLVIESLYGIELTEEDVYDDVLIEYTVNIDKKNETVIIDINFDGYLENLNSKICEAVYGEEVREINCENENYNINYRIKIEKLDEEKEYVEVDYITDDAPTNMYNVDFMDTLELGTIHTFSKDHEYDLDYIKLEIKEAGQYSFDSTNPGVVINLYNDAYRKMNTPKYWMYDLIDTSKLSVYLETGSYIIEYDPTGIFGDTVYDVTYSKVEADDKIDVLNLDVMTPIAANQEVTFTKDNSTDIDTIIFESSVESISFILEEGLDFYTETGYVGYVQVDNEVMHVRIDQTEGGAIDLSFYQSNDVTDYSIYFTEIDNSIDPLDLNGEINQSFKLDGESLRFVSYGNPGGDNELYELVVEKDSPYLIYATDSYFSIYNNDHELLYDGYDSTSITFRPGTYYLNIHDYNKLYSIVRFDKAFFDIENELEVPKRDGAFNINGIVSHHGDQDSFLLTVSEEGIYELDLDTEVSDMFWFSKIGSNDRAFHINQLYPSYVTLTPGQYKIHSDRMSDVGETYHISLVETDRTDIKYDGDYEHYTVDQTETITLTLNLDSLTDKETLSFVINQPTGFTIDVDDPYVRMKRIFTDEEGTVNWNESSGHYVTYKNGSVDFEFSLYADYINSLDLYGEYVIEIEIRLLD